VQNGRTDFTMQNAAVQHHAVSIDTRMTLISGGVPMDVAAELHYSTQDPFAVHMGLSVDDGPAVEWVFARGLLRDGLAIPTGCGDIHVFPVAAGVIIDLHSPSGSARLLADADDLARFIDEIFEVVAEDDESRYLDLDTEIAFIQDMLFPR
jgi:hypothetical protein